MAGWSPDAEPGQVELLALARCHRLCLPDTASSRAGLPVLEALYAGLCQDPAARVIWEPGPEGSPELGAFASATVRYRETELHTRRSLPKAAFARLAVRAAMMPRHVLARRRWEPLIPHEDIGYLLTLGVARAVVPSARTRRGSELLAELEAWFVSQGCTASFVDTELTNQRAHAFYSRAGYLELSRDHGQILLRKTLLTGRSR
ncbi:MAG TPA: GNAT family N-acetyltransferase [Polyangiaceae bacterium]|nr:GNAT family N-acetyltransferase [Polyangiaceae bacterium]